MSNYQQILVAVDLTDEAGQVLQHAQQIAKEHNAKLTLLTVIQPISYAYTGMDAGWISKEMASFEVDSENHARARLAELANKAGIADPEIRVVLGKPAATIKSEAKALNVNLIVLGTHGKHGLGLILGSTANGVLHGAFCDVLAVRIDTEQAVSADAA